MSTTARLAYLTLGLQAACLAVLALVAILAPEQLGSVADALGTLALAIAGGGGAGALAYGSRHIGSGALTSAELSRYGEVQEP